MPFRLILHLMLALFLFLYTNMLSVGDIVSITQDTVTFLGFLSAPILDWINQRAGVS